jgi:hypothetical protein
MFYHNEMNPASAVFHDVFGFHVHSAFEEGLFKTAAAQLVARHPALRTSFHIAGLSEPLQCVHRVVTPPVTVEDVRSLGPAEQGEKITAWIAAEKRRLFDRTVAPPGPVSCPGPEPGCLPALYQLSPFLPRRLEPGGGYDRTPPGFSGAQT